MRPAGELGDDLAPQDLRRTRQAVRRPIAARSSSSSTAVSFGAPSRSTRLSDKYAYWTIGYSNGYSDPSAEPPTICIRAGRGRFSCVELRGFEPLTFSLRKRGHATVEGSNTPILRGKTA